MSIIYIYSSRSYIDTTTFIHVYACDYMVENNLDSWFLSSTSAAINVGCEIPPQKKGPTFFGGAHVAA